ncbi:chromosomal replication initiator protein DnaA [Alicyclobacillus cellulosilyticus]|uniref:Chromosomal replication initiator protein DnaA n=1 Tax=Alicyclobacillus cellulosilyticus TaxID=1003997 RepID=A0A917K0P2_9BACL|nr:chromosomal replication initiator protein DnaA [Alicyclobacillus cellulosilyticus]GGI95030.1 chromosomal replication initiator protein DnaA [Alicyclobacillus cellulosilyticus]
MTAQSETLLFDELWNDVLRTLRPQFEPQTFDAWFRGTRIAHLDPVKRAVILHVPTSFQKNWLANRYVNLITAQLAAVTREQGWSVTFDTPVNEQNPTGHAEEAAPAEAGPVSPGETDTRIAAAARTDSFQEPVGAPLNPRYTFETFVIGNSNRFAHAACLAVAESPSQSYNPLFIYGGVGLGKTHLMHAIAHRVKQRKPHLKVVYLSTERFMNEFIAAIRDNTTEAFRDRYRTVDVLLIDDIQFLAKKDGTQEEFFHTFNALHEAGKQIVITSDCPPRAIPTLEERLRSRFEWGLITDIQPPDLETRIAILQRKAKADGFLIHDDVMAYIASQIDSNIRELEGALVRVIAYSSLVKQEITVDLAQEALKDLIAPNRPRPVTVSQIQKVVSDHFGIKPEDLIAKSRAKHVVVPRQIAMYLTRELTDLSLPKIGEAFGGRDHTTILHACEKVSEELKTNEELRRTVESLSEALRHLT